MSEKALEPAKKKKLSERKGYIIYKRIRSIFFTIILVLAVFVIIFTVITRINGGTPSLFGYSIFRVSSPSMSPAYEVGDVIIVKECEAKDLKVGDVCTYNGTKDQYAGKIITHRVIKAEYKENGEYYIVTKGDANKIDDGPIRSADVIGKVQTKLTLLRHLYNFFVTPLGLITIIALIIAAFFNEILNFVKSLLGIGYKEEENESVEDIIERYQKENKNKKDEESSD